MSECVVRMEMPSCCHDCPFEADQWDYPICRVTGRSEGYRFDARNNRMVDCPIICKLPEGHGRLVDADALMELMLERKRPLIGADNSKDRYRYMQWLADFNAIRDVKTIVPAERSEI